MHVAAVSSTGAGGRPGIDAAIAQPPTRQPPARQNRTLPGWPRPPPLQVAALVQAAAEGDRDAGASLVELFTDLLARVRAGKVRAEG